MTGGFCHWAVTARFRSVISVTRRRPVPPPEEPVGAATPAQGAIVSAAARSRQTTMGPPITLPDPTRPPRPVKGCDVCAALDRQRIEAERRGNVGQATTCEQEIRSHPHGDGTT